MAGMNSVTASEQGGTEQKHHHFFDCYCIRLYSPPNCFDQGEISNHSDKQEVRITLTTPKPHPLDRLCMQKRIIDRFIEYFDDPILD